MPTTMQLRYAAQIPWLTFQNDTGETVPPFSCVKATGWHMPDPNPGEDNVDSPYLICEKPDGDGAPFDHYITNEVQVPAGAFGSCTRPEIFAVIARIEGAQQDGSDNEFRLLGPQAGKWGLVRDVPGFFMLDLPQQGYALVRTSCGPYAGRLTGSAIHDDTINVATYTRSMRLVPSAINVLCYNPFGTIDATEEGANLEVTFDWVGGQWELVAGDPCPPG